MQRAQNLAQLALRAQNHILVRFQGRNIHTNAPAQDVEQWGTTILSAATKRIALYPRSPCALGVGKEINNHMNNRDIMKTLLESMDSATGTNSLAAAEKKLADSGYQYDYSLGDGVAVDRNHYNADVHYWSKSNGSKAAIIQNPDSSWTLRSIKPHISAKPMDWEAELNEDEHGRKDKPGYYLVKHNGDYVPSKIFLGPFNTKERMRQEWKEFDRESKNKLMPAYWNGSHFEKL